jgi:hypothetical protein
MHRPGGARIEGSEGAVGGERGGIRHEDVLVTYFLGDSFDAIECECNDEDNDNSRPELSKLLKTKKTIPNHGPDYY